jgi:putative drug exporter of the RND superfamily
LVVAVVGIALVGPIAGRLTSSQALPGLPSYEAGLSILHTYGNGGDNTPIVAVVTLPGSEQVDSPAGRAALSATFSGLSSQRSLRVVSYPTVNDPRLISPNGHTALGLVFTGDSPPSSVRLATWLRASAPTGVRVATTSINDLQNAPGGGGIGVLGEVFIGAVGALLVLALVFGSFLAVAPLIVAAVSILGTFLLLGALTMITGVSQLVEYLVALIGLGVAIDYSLLIVTRWREERDRGQSNDEAVVLAMATAGRSVLFSAVTVAVGLFALIAVPFSFVRSLGYGGLLIPLVTVIAALTLLPVLLSAWGPRLDRRSRRAVQRHQRRAGLPSRAWSAWSKGVIRHRILAVATALTVLGILCGAAFGLRVGEARPTSLARSGPAERGLVTLQHVGFPVGVLSPIEILVPVRTDPAVLAARLSIIHGVDAAIAPTGAAWRRSGTAIIDVFPSAPTSSPTDSATVSTVRATVARLAPGAQVAGDGPLEADLVHAFYSRFPLIIALVALLSLLALARAFRSVVLAIKAVVVNVLSVGAAYGALVLIWQHGYGSRALWGIPATGVVVDFVPLMVFAFLFGLSMDYEVFILSRIKEAHDAGKSTDEAVVEGLGHTGRLVTSAAIILFLAFAALAAGPDVQIKVFATGMAVGILLDATVVRALLVPALVSLLGKWNWWLPWSHPGSAAERLGTSSEKEPVVMGETALIGQASRTTTVTTEVAGHRKTASPRHVRDRTVRRPSSARRSSGSSIGRRPVSGLIARRSMRFGFVVGLVLTVIWATTGAGYFWPGWLWFALALPAAVSWSMCRALRTKIRRSEAVHAALSLVISATLIAIWVLSSHRHFWPIWPILVFVVILAAHALFLPSASSSREQVLNAPPP